MFLLSRPLHLLLAASTYFLGVGLADYLGYPFLPETFWLGAPVVLLAQSGMALAAELFRPSYDPLHETETRLQRFILRNNLLIVVSAILAVLAIFALILFSRKYPSAFFLLLFSFAVIVAYSVPPLRLLDRGFGEFLLAAHIAYVVPSFGFLLQTKTFHILLPALLLPLASLTLACLLALNFQSYADDQKYQRLTMLRLLTWERAVPLHHSLVIGAYLLFLAAGILFSVNVLWRVFLSFPFALFQILQLRAIALGARPNWKLLSVNVFALVGLTTYVLILSLHLR